MNQKHQQKLRKGNLFHDDLSLDSFPWNVLPSSAWQKHRGERTGRKSSLLGLKSHTCCDLMQVTQYLCASCHQSIRGEIKTTHVLDGLNEIV